MPVKEILRGQPLLREIKGVIGFETPFMRKKGLIPEGWDLYNLFFTIRYQGRGRCICEYSGHIDREEYGNREIEKIEGRVELSWTEVQEILEIFKTWGVYGIDYIVYTVNGRKYFARSLLLEKWEVNGTTVRSEVIKEVIGELLK